MQKFEVERWVLEVISSCHWPSFPCTWHLIEIITLLSCHLRAAGPVLLLEIECEEGPTELAAGLSDEAGRWMPQQISSCIID